ncbi:hypothetical protein, partial [Rhodoblastus sphagnicola]|uniref:hypothetical protein n=1 Tax=Rhodoblastus sphagnicola TaxID=333368 RepID=UPI001AED3500
HAQFPLRRHSNLPSIIDEAGVPQLLACGEQTLRAENPAQVAGFKSESVAGLNRNSHRSRSSPNSDCARAPSLAARLIFRRVDQHGRVFTDALSPEAFRARR